MAYHAKCTFVFTYSLVEIQKMTNRFFRHMIGGALMAMMLTSGAFAQNTLSETPVTPEYHRIERLMNAGAYQDAMIALDKNIQGSPKSLNYKFLRTVILDKMGKKEQAASALEALIRDYPEVADPYNNLAVIRASQGNIAEAKRLLEKAIVINPNYATGRKNLADLYLLNALTLYREAQPKLPYNKPLQERIKKLEALLKPAQH